MYLSECLIFATFVRKSKSSRKEHENYLSYYGVEYAHITCTLSGFASEDFSQSLNTIGWFIEDGPNQDKIVQIRLTNTFNLPR